MFKTLCSNCSCHQRKQNAVTKWNGPRHFADVLELAAVHTLHANSISVKVSDIIPLELIQGHG